MLNNLTIYYFKNKKIKDGQEKLCTQLSHSLSKFLITGGEKRLFLQRVIRRKIAVEAQEHRRQGITKTETKDAYTEGTSNSETYTEKDCRILQIA